MADMKSSVGRHWPWILSLLGLPMAALGLILPVNEYESWGGAGIDCDGPFMLTFIVPAITVYAVCGLAFARRAAIGRSWPSVLAFLACALLVAALGMTGIAALRELREPDYRASCT